MATLSYRIALAIWFADVEALLTAQLLYAAERCVAAHHDADVGYFGIGQHVPCFGGLRNEVLPVMDHVSEDGPKETAARDELIIHPILGQGAQFASLMTCWRPALFQALSLEVYATVRLGRAPLLGRSRSTERVCPCVCFRVNQRQD